MENFTPVASLIGGVVIGLASIAMLLFNGRIAGISGIAGGTLIPASKSERPWRLIFVAGLLAGGFLSSLAMPEWYAFTVDRSWAALAVAGLVVGFGTRLGSGCTSGHGVCGISRLSVRSIVATLTFMATGAATVYVVNHVFGGL